MTKLVFSSDQFPVHLSDQDRFKQWRDFYVAHVGETDVVRSPAGRFFSRCELLRFDKIAVVQSKYTAERITRQRHHISSDARDNCVIGIFSNNARCRFDQRGREIEFSKGRPYIALIGEPFTCSYDSPHALRGVVVPRTVLRERIPGVSFDQAACMMPSPMWQHLDRYLSVLLDTDFQSSPALASQAENYVTDVLALALGASGDFAELAKSRGLRAIRLREAVAEIERRYAEPAFSSDDLAKAVGLSRRYVNELLYESGMTFAERVLELRLHKARAILADARHDRLRVGDIAFACGFNDVSYFNRRFRARFGCSPTQCRGGH